MNMNLSSLLLPLQQRRGFLPPWILLTALLALFQSAKAYQPTTPLRNDNNTTQARSRRRLGTWTLLSGIVRMCAVREIGNGSLYGLALSTYVIAAAHFAAECVLFGEKVSVGALGVSGVSIVWMLVQWDHYVFHGAAEAGAG